MADNSFISPIFRQTKMTNPNDVKVDIGAFFRRSYLNITAKYYDHFLTEIF